MKLKDKMKRDIEMMEKRPSIRKDSRITELESTNWNAIIVAGVISALNAVENSVIGIGEWPYMSEIDRSATATFFGYATSVSKCAHAIFAMVFSFWSYKSQSVRIPLLTSRFISLAACCLYLSVEYFPSGRRYVMMSVYVILGIANSACTVLRAYIAMFSTGRDRPRAFATIGLSVVVSIIVGPLLQLIFSAIPYPGFEILPGIKFHIYSAPDRSKDDESVGSDLDQPSVFSWEKIKMTWMKLRKSSMDWTLIFVCLACKVGGVFSHATMQTLMSILLMVQYGWTREETVQAGAVIMISFGVMSLGVLLFYIFGNLGTLIPQQYVYLIATLASGSVYVITYPFSFTSSPVAPWNETTRSGCNILDYSWCDGAVAASPWLFLVVVVVLSAPSIPLMHTSLDTIYSKILGNVDQSIAQGAMTVIDDIVFMVTPVFATEFFTYFGIGPLWIAKAMVFFSLTFIWFINLKRITPHM
ncbi:unnamed protein product [Caenorhabditis angaria]|uniref:Major facilitator superfamily (MFS) profile domain-containing protein n=1 Tax=Caenorhabditis angaria TaxID=860376 RepID=A0A9P1IU77_9PELO|nr:unnamed protein product [Caenorhabditis angaria]